MSKAKAAPPECAVCAALPLLHDQPKGYAGPLRPSTPRPVVYGKTRPSRRCHTHREADRKAQKARAHDTGVQRTFGVPEGWYAAQLARQGGKCAFPRCRAIGKARRLAVDHDRQLAVQAIPGRHPVAHDKDRACRYCVRGLLCGPHNFDLMGKFLVDLEDAIRYRDNPPAQTWRWEPGLEVGA
jgi:hypothetical protein